jgi:signal transduction histidine kinase
MSYGKNKIKEKPKAGQVEVVSINQLSQNTNQFFTRLASNLRLSISLRITINYWRMIFKSALLIWVLFSLAFGGLAYYEANNLIETTAAELSKNPPIRQNAGYSDAKDSDIVKLQDPLGQEYYIEWPNDLNTRNYLDYPLAGYLPYDHSKKTLYIHLNRDLLFDNEIWQLHYWVNLKQSQVIYIYVILGLLIIDAFRIIYFLIKSKKLNHSLMQPIDEIAGTARRITAENLSQRINVHGTKNELKDLASVINDLLDRLEVAYNSQKQFVSDASHELRTPIAVIQGYAGLLERWGKSDPEVIDEALAAIVNESANMQSLVENLLFLARHDKKTWNLTLEPVLTQELVESIVKETEMLTNEHEIKLGVMEDCYVIADKNAIKQALRIFADNSIKYTPPGGCISFSSRREGEWAVLTVQDNGQGINKNDLNKVFNRFYRSDQVRNSTASNHGYGLGLSIARILVSAHHGKIRVRSVPEEGSEFSILLKREV